MMKNTDKVIQVTKEQFEKIKKLVDSKQEINKKIREGKIDEIDKKNFIKP